MNKLWAAEYVKTAALPMPTQEQELSEETEAPVAKSRISNMALHALEYGGVGLGALAGAGALAYPKFKSV